MDYAWKYMAASQSRPECRSQSVLVTERILVRTDDHDVSSHCAECLVSKRRSPRKGALNVEASYVDGSYRPGRRCWRHCGLDGTVLRGGKLLDWRKSILPRMLWRQEAELQTGLFQISRRDMI